MTIAVWRDEYHTGHPEIDQQHQQLFQLVNQIHHLTQSEQPDHAAIYSQLNEFASCAITHFDLEEALMAQHGYPNFAVHCQTHRALVNKVQTLLTKFDQTAETQVAVVTEVLADWMVHHIRGEDRQMIRFFQASNAVEISGSLISTGIERIAELSQA
ncbi:MAG: hemerythrin family protein [Leptolyngbya sp. SIOISBB]|nr:hemerythrin family protein [Leptolyngbya sp. SIOISBB]